MPLIPLGPLLLRGVLRPGPPVLSGRIMMASLARATGAEGSPAGGGGGDSGGSLSSLYSTYPFQLGPLPPPLGLGGKCPGPAALAGRIVLAALASRGALLALLESPAPSTRSQFAPLPLPSRALPIPPPPPRRQLDPDTGVFKADPKLSFAHPYPTTKIMFSPEKVGSRPHALASAAAAAAPARPRRGRSTLRS